MHCGLGDSLTNTTKIQLLFVVSALVQRVRKRDLLIAVVEVDAPFGEELRSQHEVVFFALQDQ